MVKCNINRIEEFIPEVLLIIRCSYAPMVQTWKTESSGRAESRVARFDDIPLGIKIPHLHLSVVLRGRNIIRLRTIKRIFNL